MGRILTRWQQFIKWFITPRKVALALLVFGAGIVGYGYGVTRGVFAWEIFVSEVYSNFGIELVSIGLTVVVIESLNRSEATRERKEELILQMGSPNNDFAIEAVRILRLKGWLKDGSLRGADLVYANLQEASLGGAHLGGAHLYKSKLQKTDLSSANLQKADLREANLQRALLVLGDLQGADLLHAHLEGINLNYANLQKARMGYANLQGAVNSEGANFQGVDLQGANLQDASLPYADFKGANLVDANFQGADLLYTKWDIKTVLPDRKTWTPHTDIERFTNPEHPQFWRSDNPFSPAYRGNSTAPSAKTD